MILTCRLCYQIGNISTGNGTADIACATTVDTALTQGWKAWFSSVMVVIASLPAREFRRSRDIRYR